MRYGFFALLLLLALTPIGHEADINKMHSCTFFDAHGSYAKVFVWAATIEAAERNAEEVRLRLINKNVIPENTGILCEEPLESK